jgi:hypothetical protein
MTTTTTAAAATTTITTTSSTPAANTTTTSTTAATATATTIAKYSFQVYVITATITAATTNHHRRQCHHSAHSPHPLSIVSSAAPSLATTTFTDTLGTSSASPILQPPARSSSSHLHDSTPSPVASFLPSFCFLASVLPSANVPSFPFFIPPPPLPHCFFIHHYFFDPFLCSFI